MVLKFLWGPNSGANVYVKRAQVELPRTIHDPADKIDDFTFRARRNLTYYVLLGFGSESGSTRLKWLWYRPTGEVIDALASDMVVIVE